MQPHEEQATDEFLSALTWYDVTHKVSKRAGRLRFEWARSGITLTIPDTIIAATALEYGLVLITNNRKHFPMPELSIYPVTSISWL
jgi:predicted nucleic acid-binding protein